MAVALRGRRSPSRVLAVASALIAAGLLVPLVFLVLQAAHAGWHDVFRLLFRRLTWVLLINTVELALLVCAACAVLGTGAAWLVERTSLPFRRAWAVLIVLPVAIPDFVVGYAWNSIFPAVHGLAGATLVMTLAVYPLVYLPVAAALRRSDFREEEVARSLGLGPFKTFSRITLRQIRPALTGGCLLVCLALLAEYGAFEIVRFQTFTTTIFTEVKSGGPAGVPIGAGLSLVLVILGLLVLVAEGAVSTRGRLGLSGAAQGQGERAGRFRLRRGQAVAATLPVLALVALGVGMPVGVLAYWMASSHSTTLPGGSVWGALWSTAAYSSAGALIATAAALPVALLVVRFRSAGAVVLERSTYIAQCLPGLVIALALAYFATRYAPRLYQTGPLLVVAYAILFFPLALVCVRASVAQAPRQLEEVGRSLGHRPAGVLLRVTLPLVAPGLAAGFCLVFLSAVTELTATLLLVPTGVHTLATQFWAYQTNTSYGAAAPYAVVIVAMAAVPAAVLTLWFDRRPAENPT
jgi:iron(III) transport system permease protein